MTLKNLYGQHRATKIVFLMLVSTLFLIPLVSALDWDNKLTYSSEDMKVGFDNLFGLGKHFGEVELKSHKFVEEIIYVSHGKDKVVMYYDFSGWGSYKNGLGEVYFTDEETGKEIQKDYYFAERVIYNECTDFKNTTKDVCVKKERWDKLEFNDIPNRNIRIGLVTDVGIGDYIDAVWTIAGKKVKRHAGWSSDNDIISGLPDLGTYTSPEVFYMDESWYLISGETFGQARGYVWDGSSWITNLTINATLGDMSSSSKPEVFYKDSSWYLIMGANNNFTGFAWNSGEWVVNSTIISGLPSETDAYYFSSVFYKDSSWYLLSGDGGHGGAGVWFGYVWNGTDWTSNATIKAGLPTVGSGTYFHGSAFYKGSSWRLIYGQNDGKFYGYTWGGTEWEVDEEVNESLPDIGTSSEPTIFYKDDYWYLISGNSLGTFNGFNIYAPEDTAPTIILNSPTNHTNSTTNAITFNCTAYDIENLVNVSLILDGVVNETNSTDVINNSFYYFEKILSEGNHYWSCRGADNDSQVTTAGEFLININTTPNIYFNAGVPVNNYNSTTNSFEVNVTLTETYFKNITFDLYNRLGALNQSVTFTNASRKKEWTNLPDGDYSYNVTTATTTNQFNQTATRNITIDTTVPVVDVFSPTANIEFHENKTNLYINWSVNDTHLSHCIYNYNSTNMTLTCSDNQTAINITDYSNTNLTFWVNDTLGNMNTTFVSWEYRLFEVSQTFTASVSEGYASTFTLNILTNGSDITLANLSYDNGQNIGTITEGTTDNFTITKSVIAPPVTTDTNKTFFWNITQSNFNYAFDEQTQTVTNIGIDNCSTNTIVLYNFTIVNEETQVKLPLGNANTTVNTTGRINLQLMSVDRTTSLTNYSTLFNKTNPFYVCLNATFGTGEKFVVDVQVEYDADGYEKEFYHIQNETLNSTTINMNKTLYDLLSADSQEFKLIVKDASYLALADALIEVQRKYVDEGVFKVVEIPKTDEQGETTARLVVNDAIYNFVIKKYGVTIKTISNVIPVCQIPAVTTCKIDFNAFTTSIEVPDYEVGRDFNYTLGYNSTTKVVSSVFDIPSGTPATIVLSVIVDDELGTSVCTDTLTTNTGTLSCIVPNSFGNATVLAKLTRDDLEVARGNIKLDQDPSDIYGTSLVFLGLFAMLTLIGASVSDNPVYTLVFFMLGVALLFALNLVANNGFIGGTATILWLVVAIVIVLIKGARRN